MNENQKIYIRGSKDRPDDIRRGLEQLGGKVVGIAFLIELEALKGREKLKDYNVYSVLTY